MVEQSESLHPTVVSSTHFIQTQIVALVDGAIAPAPAVPTRTRISARLKLVARIANEWMFSTACVCVRVSGVWLPAAFD